MTPTDPQFRSILIAAILVGSRFEFHFASGSPEATKEIDSIATTVVDLADAIIEKTQP